MLSKTMNTALNKHMNIELFSAYLYLNMAAAANEMGYKGTANWFNVQYQEEMVHFMKFYTYINSQGAQAVVDKMAKPASSFSSLLNFFQELSVTEKDHASQIFLQWFITEQIEEEENDREIIGKVKMIGDNGYGLLMLDNELGARVFTPPATAA
jgi:ferritin